jgi:hypothetical protein
MVFARQEREKHLRGLERFTAGSALNSEGLPDISRRPGELQMQKWYQEQQRSVVCQLDNSVAKTRGQPRVV